MRYKYILKGFIGPFLRGHAPVFSHPWEIVKCGNLERVQLSDADWDYDSSLRVMSCNRWELAIHFSHFMQA